MTKSGKEIIDKINNLIDNSITPETPVPTSLKKMHINTLKIKESGYNASFKNLKKIIDEFNSTSATVLSFSPDEPSKTTVLGKDISIAYKETKSFTYTVDTIEYPLGSVLELKVEGSSSSAETIIKDGDTVLCSGSHKTGCYCKRLPKILTIFVTITSRSDPGAFTITLENKAFEKRVFKVGGVN